MPTSRAENQTLLQPRLLLATLALFCWPGVTQAVDYGNEVSVWIEQDRAVATSNRIFVFGSRLSGWEEFE